MSSFQNSHGFSINGGAFYNAQTAHHTHYTSLESPASDHSMAILLRHTAINASHESAHNAYEPRCSPGTRKEVIKDILTWAGDVGAAPPIAWLSGPAGAGKTSIQRDVAAALQGMSAGDRRPSDGGPERLAASYFFSGQLSTKSGSNTGADPSTLKLDTIQPFIATIAYQMASTIPGLRPHIEKAIKRDPLVFEKGVAVQAQKVLMEPLQSWKSDSMQPTEVELPRPRGWWRRTFKRLWARAHSAAKVGAKVALHSKIEPAIPVPRTISVDGYDEIKDRQERGQLLNTIRTLACFEPFPLRFIIASRPELDLTNIFTSDALASIVRRIQLET